MLSCFRGLTIVGLLAAGAGCHRKPALPPPPAGPQVSGTLAVAGLSAAVRIVRDRWGVPHIYASSRDDLFFAQGFVQAQDRLFQMDVWRRSVQGRLSEVLGANFIDRDVMTRRMQYRGDPIAEWASYDPEARAIAEAFVRGVNAQVAIARGNPPEAFRLAGWLPETWRAEDLLSRTEAFSMSANAEKEILRARLVNALGAARVDDLFPLDPASKTAIPRGVDLASFNFVIANALRRIGTPVFFSGLAAPLGSDVVQDFGPARDASNNWVVDPSRTGTGRPLVANDPHRALDHPSLRYLVHLDAPGWHVAGSVVPWFPGVAIGHNDRVAWGLTIFDADAQDIYVERVNPANPRQVEDRGRWVNMEIVRDSVPVKGRAKPFPFERQYTRHGVVFATDKERHRAFTLRWTGSEPGTAGYLAALALDRARSADGFRQALARWKMPGENFVYADVDGHVGYQAAALVPVRRTWNGTLPVPGWSGEYEWQGWYGLDDLPHANGAPRGYLATANDNTVPRGDRRVIGFQFNTGARINRVDEVLDASPTIDLDASKRLQLDVLAWNAERIVPLLTRVRATRGDVDEVRRRLLAWDRRLTVDSPDASMYVAWEDALVDGLVAGKVEPDLAAAALALVRGQVVFALTKPSRAWFGADPVRARDALLVSALERAFDELRKRSGVAAGLPAWGTLHTATFTYPLSVSAGTRKLFDVGPFARPGYGSTVNATGGPGFEQTSGASFREVIDVGDWDRSVVTSAPGQSEWPRSPHFADLAKLWAAGEYFPLVFGEAAVQANAESTLTLTPATTPSRN